MTDGEARSTQTVETRDGQAVGEKWEKALRPLVGKKVESVRVDDYGVVYITAPGFGGRVIAKIGEPRRG